MALDALNKETFFSMDETAGFSNRYRLMQFDYADSLRYNATSDQLAEIAQTSPRASHVFGHSESYGETQWANNSTFLNRL